ncbi:MAG: RNA methyltransferase [Bacteroidetes bacterium]|nr:RNA methyltransferase [Bacteroidota bacterium]MDA0888602.1 RNA methyltransferase [Bacteroidota bacterium]MDA1085028.1 RNA methyltransferase [Bacteroidota bacterium]
MKHISSTQNAAIKAYILLQSKAKVRTEKKQFVVEGRRELQLSQLADYTVSSIFWCPEIFEKAEFEDWIAPFQNNIDVTSVSLNVYQKMVVRDSTEGVVGIAAQKNKLLESWKPNSKNPLILVLESIEKPGNLGAILRTADASGVDAVIITEEHTDIHNPNVIRSSVGGFFSSRIFLCSNEEAKRFLVKNNVIPYAASLQKNNVYTQADYTKPTAFVMGSEAKGLSEFWRKQDIIAVKIPMLGNVDSLNVSVATAILAYEAIRQRNC